MINFTKLSTRQRQTLLIVMIIPLIAIIALECLLEASKLFVKKFANNFTNFFTIYKQIWHSEKVERSLDNSSRRSEDTDTWGV